MGTAAESFATLLKQYRAAARLTQEEVAERAGLSARTVSDLERGIKHRPYPHTVQRLAQALELDEPAADRFVSAARRHAPDSNAPDGPDGDIPPHIVLPIQPTTFVGRQAEVEQVRLLFERKAVRLLTLTGPGGVGKTRLAVRVAEEMAPSIPGGVFFVSLASVTDPGLILGTIATVIQGVKRGRQTSLERLTEDLQDKAVLLVLDNFEHLLPAAGILSHLLAACPQLIILVTSRAILHLAAEHEYQVPPLPTPTPMHLPDLDTLSRYDAVSLFVERARAVKPGFELTDQNATAIAEICCQLDGLPLAIELAAARIRMFWPQMLLARLRDRLDLISRGPLDMPSRQQTLRATLDWSYYLLPPEDAGLFARLSTFVGGCTLGAAEAVCTSTVEFDVVEGMTDLLEHSLLQRQDGKLGPRFAMLETVRAYAGEKLEAMRESEALRDRHAQYYMTLAADAPPDGAGVEAVAWLDRVEANQENLRAALRWLLDVGKGEQALRLATNLYSYWTTRCHYADGQRWLEVGLERAADALTELRAIGFGQASVLATLRGDYVRAMELGLEGLRLRRVCGGGHELVGTLLALALSSIQRQDYGTACSFLQEALTESRALGYTRGVYQSLHLLGEIALNTGECERAVAMTEESLALIRAAEDAQFLVNSLDNLARALLCTGDLRRALPLWTEGLGLARQWGDTRGIAYYLEGLAAAAAAQGRPTRAGHLAGMAHALREAIHSPRSPAEDATLQRFLAPARDLLGEEVWAQIYEEGRAMTLEEALA